MRVFDAPKGRGPYGITATPDGEIYFASLAGSYVGRVDTTTGKVTVIEPPTPDQGARRVWADSKGNVWVSEWNAGQLSRYTPASGAWRSWKLPGDHPKAYAVYVDDNDIVWVSDFGANAVLRFDPRSETFTSFKDSAAERRGSPDPRPTRRSLGTGVWYRSADVDPHRRWLTPIASLRAALRQASARKPEPARGSMENGVRSFCRSAMLLLDEFRQDRAQRSNLFAWAAMPWQV